MHAHRAGTGGFPVRCDQAAEDEDPGGVSLTNAPTRCRSASEISKNCTSSPVPPSRKLRTIAAQEIRWREPGAVKQRLSTPPKSPLSFRKNAILAKPDFAADRIPGVYASIKSDARYARHILSEPGRTRQREGEGLMVSQPARHSA